MTKHVLLLDIEGTVCPFDFVKKTLFPFARARYAQWVAANLTHPLLASIGRDAAAVAQTLTQWADADEKVTSLKAVQGLIWREGYESGELVAPLYDDVAPAIAAWQQAGARVAIYSSGSIEAQQLLFAHSSAGDVTPGIAAYFDTTSGPKRAATSYLNIARHLETAPSNIVFCTDIEAELVAAQEAGLKACLIDREASSVLPLPPQY